MSTSPLIGRYDSNGTLVGIVPENSKSAAPFVAPSVSRDSSGNPSGLVDPVTGFTILTPIFVSGCVANDSSNATKNTGIIQSALNSGGYVYLNTPGLVYYNSPFTIYDNTQFIIGPATKLVQAPNNNGLHFLHNSQWQAIAWAPTSQVTTTGAAMSGSNRYSLCNVSVTEAAATDLATANFIQISGDTNHEFNGIWPIYSVVGTTVRFLIGQTGYATTSSAPIATLSSSVTASQTSLAVSSAVGFPASGPFAAWVENEKVWVTAGAGTTTWTVTRGYDSSISASHASGTSISTLTVCKANGNIQVDVYGLWDYNEQNGNGGTTSQSQQGLYMNRVRNFRSNCFRGRGNKAVIHCSNVEFPVIRNFDCDTGSDG